MASIKLPNRTKNIIDEIIDDYKEKHHLFESFNLAVFTLLSGHPLIKDYIHFIKRRVKEPSHLKDKLKRKAKEAFLRNEAFDIDLNNVYERIQDLSGVRILHLHTKQMELINNGMLSIIEEQSYHKIEGPISNIWDIEYENYFRGLGMEIKKRDSMYTSIHYVIAANTRDKVRCEIQVRTLMEEVWGEVSHKIDYPHPTKSIACREQIKTLARVTSGGTRLVDSIFDSLKEYNSFKQKRK